MINMETPTKQQEDNDDSNIVKIDNKNKVNNNNTTTKLHSAKFKIDLNLKPRPYISKDATRAREKWLCENQWDSVPFGTSSREEVPVNVKYLVVDVETHNWNETDFDGRIVEIAWNVYGEKGDCLSSKNYLLKPHGYNEIAPKATRIHGITTTLAVNHGSDANKVFNEFTAIIRVLPNDGFVVAYRMLFEDSIFMCNLTEEQKIIWDNAPKCDVYSMKLWKYLPNYQGKLSRQKGWRTIGMRLTNLHKIVCTTPKSCTDFAHMAGNDAEMTWDIFAYYYYKSDASHNELKWEPDRRKYSSVRVQHP